MMTAEVRTEKGIVKYEYFADDFDTIMVRSPEGTKFSDGFDLVIWYNYVNSEELSCKIIPKSDVAAIYNAWDDDKEYFGKMRVWIYELEDGRVKVIADEKPTKYKDEFTYEEYDIDRGDQYPPIRSSRYYLITSADDPRISRSKEHIHKDIRFEIPPTGLTEQELKEKTYSFVKQKMHNAGCDQDRLYSLLLGCYGYRIPHDLLSTDIDLVFERLLPEYYHEIVDNGPYAGPNLCRDLMMAIYRHMPEFDSWFMILNGKEVKPSPVYLHYMYLQFHLKLMEMLQKGTEPYTRIDLRGVMEYLEEDCCDYIDDHSSVSWNGKIICEDIGAYTKQALEKLSYFEQFRQ